MSCRWGVRFGAELEPGWGHHPPYSCETPDSWPLPGVLLFLWHLLTCVRNVPSRSSKAQPQAQPHPSCGAMGDPTPPHPTLWPGGGVGLCWELWVPGLTLHAQAEVTAPCLWVEGHRATEPGRERLLVRGDTLRAPCPLAVAAGVPLGEVEGLGGSLISQGLLGQPLAVQRCCCPLAMGLRETSLSHRPHCLSHPHVFPWLRAGHWGALRPCVGR